MNRIRITGLVACTQRYQRELSELATHSAAARDGNERAVLELSYRIRADADAIADLCQTEVYHWAVCPFDRDGPISGCISSATP